MTVHAITGQLIAAGRITICDSDADGIHDDTNSETISGILIEMSDDDLRAIAGQSLGKTIEVRPVDSAERAVIDAAVKYRDAQKVWIEVCKSVEGVGGIEAEAKIIAAWQPVNDARGDMCSAAEALP